VVRVNGAGTEWHTEDLAAVRGKSGVRAVMLPKADDVDVVAGVVAALRGMPVFALVESARGIREADAIAEVPGVTRLVFGNVDFGLDAGTTVSDVDERELLYARSRLVVASRAAGLAAPIDGVTTNLDDPAEAAVAARRARHLGFGGKLCLHPRQIGPVTAAFSPDEAELAWARRVLAAAGDSAGAAVRVDGQMIDRPRLELARRLLED
jgi:citrate lyase beta subunit